MSKRDADFDNFVSRSSSGLIETEMGEGAKWIDNATKNWDVFLLDIIKAMCISENINAYLTTFDQQKQKWSNLPIHKSKKTYQEVPEQMGFQLEDPEDESLFEDRGGGEAYRVANWYKKIK